MKRLMMLAMVLSLSIAVLFGCGGGGGGSAGSGGGGTAITTTINGIGSAGPVTGATIEVFSLLSGQPGAAPLATTVTGADGSYSVDLGSYDGPVMIVMTGGTYIDEATGNPTQLAAEAPGGLRAMVDVAGNGPVTVAVTPLTELAVLLAGTDYSAANINAVNGQIGTLIAMLNANAPNGIDIIGTLPVVDPNATAEQKAAQTDYAFFLALLSQMTANRIPAATVAELLGELGTNMDPPGHITDLGLAAELLQALIDFSQNQYNSTGIFTIIAEAGEGGTATPLGMVIVHQGAAQNFDFTPDDGFHVADVLVDGFSEGAMAAYSFTNIASWHTLQVSFEANPPNLFTIDASAGLGGTIDPAGAVSVIEGSFQSFAITPDAGYHILDVLVDGISAGPITTYDFNNVTADHTIAVSFEVNPPNTFTIAATAGAGGTISPVGAISVIEGDLQSFSITPDLGFHVADVLVDGLSVGAVATYTFTNVTVDHTFAASFAPNLFTITASAGADGRITPAGAVIVNQGSSQSFDITPDTGFHIADVLVDGFSEGAIATYSFSNVAADHSIAVSFAPDQPTTATIKLTTSGIFPPGTLIGGIDVTLTLPDGVTVAPVGGGQTGPGVVVPSGLGVGSTMMGNYTPATPGTPGTVHIMSLSPNGIGVGEFVTINCEVAQGFFPVAADFTLSLSDIIDLSGTTLVPDIGADILSAEIF